MQKSRQIKGQSVQSLFYVDSQTYFIRQHHNNKLNSPSFIFVFLLVRFLCGWVELVAMESNKVTQISYSVTIAEWTVNNELVVRDVKLKTVTLRHMMHLFLWLLISIHDWMVVGSKYQHGVIYLKLQDYSWLIITGHRRTSGLCYVFPTLDQFQPVLSVCYKKYLLIYLI